MYSVGDTLPVDDLDAGTYLLAGPAMSGKYELLLGLVAEGIEAGEPGLFVTTNEEAEEVIDDLAGSGPEALRLVDCVSERHGGAASATDQVEYVASPADLTGIGIAVSEQLRRIAEAGAGGNRVAFHSVSTLLMYAELETVFRFLHVLTGRVDGLDGLGVFAIDPSTHDDSTVNTLKQLFDGMIEVREGDEGPEMRLVGVGSASTEWVARP